uniref:hypothetical protein n=1 Tax=Nocardioides pelophilus TaxID=2172019 RepID=UPI0016023AFF
VVATLAERHADAVTALERVTAPVFAVVGTEPTPPRSRAARKATSAKPPTTRSKPKPTAPKD